MKKYLVVIKLFFLGIGAWVLYKFGRDSVKLKDAEDAIDLKEKYEDIDRKHIGADDVYLSYQWLHKD